MKYRCSNPKSQQYKNYGGRGISVCSRWLEKFDNFLGDMGEKPEGMSIERIDVNGNYEPNNCKWATNLEQQKNKRNCQIIEFNGKKMTIREWAKEIGRHEATLSYRVRIGLPVHEILSPEITKRGRCSAPREKLAIKESRYDRSRRNSRQGNPDLRGNAPTPKPGNARSGGRNGRRIARNDQQDDQVGAAKAERVRPHPGF
jgi:hypothetical protein